MNAFTVDVEDWFHICGVGGALASDSWDTLPSRVEHTTDLLLEELDAAGVTATFFVLGWVARRYPSLVNRIQGAGHAIGSHGYWHTRVYDLSRDAFSADLGDSVRALAAAGVDNVRAFRAPEWSLNATTPWAFEVLVQHGFMLDCSMAPVRIVGKPSYPRTPHRYCVANGTITEVPPFVVDRYGNALPLGWGWALRRATPRDLARAIEQANRQGHPAVLTVHPWEIDPQPPRVRLPLRQHIAHYFRLSGFLGRLRRVLQTVPFSTLDSVARRAPPL